MRIEEILEDRKPCFSFEFFPPKTEEGMENLFRAASELRRDDPAFVSVTYGAGGSTRDLTIQVTKRIRRRRGVVGNGLSGGCRAHLAALEYLWNGGDSDAVNLGSERGFSVLEVIESAEHVCGQAIEHRIAPRRGGDPPVLVASSKKARNILGWTAIESDLETIIGSAWRWEQGRAQSVPR